MTEAAAAPDRTKLFLFASMTCAAAFGAWYGAPGWHGFPTVCAVAFVAAFVLGRAAGDAALIASFAALYLVPALISVLHGEYYWPFHIVWHAWMLGALLSRSAISRWHVPERWRLPLGFWALIVGMSWPLIAARESDFHFSVLRLEHIANSGFGGLPWWEASWVANVALIVGVTLLCFDWFFEAFANGDPARFRNAVVVPLGASMVVACAVALYQGLVDITWLSGGQWPSHQRAAATLMDGDAFGALAGWWTGAFAALGFSRHRSARLRSLAIVGCAVAWGGVWASGSRMGFVSALIGLGFLAPEIARVFRSASAQRMKILAAVAAVVLVVVGLASRARWTTQSPVSRALLALPSPTPSAIRGFVANQFWNRGAPYGSASVGMFADSPLVGVGEGAFHILFPDYAYALVGRRSDPDNAQSWYRQQFAEIGIIGSLGWVVWMASFAALMFRARPLPDHAAEARILRGPLVAAALVSAVSMPSQHAANAVTIMTFACWFTLLVNSSAPERPVSERMSPHVSRGAMWTVATAYAAWTLYLGVTHLRPPMRALRFDWSYAYGLYEPEVIDGRISRWTQKNAVAVFKAPKPWIRIVYWTNHSDLATRPVAVRIWCDSERVVQARLASAKTEVVYWHVPVAATQMMLETWVDHVVRPREAGLPDDRDLGLALTWDFVDAPPADAAGTD